MHDLPGWLLSVLSVYLVIWSLLGLALIVGAIVLVVKIKGLVGRVSKKIEGIADQVKVSADRVTETVNVVTDRAQRISETAETTARSVAEKVDATTAIIRDAVATPAINLSAALTGVRKGLEAWLEKRRARRSASEDSAE